VSGAGDIFDEQGIRNNGLRQFCQNVQWGRSLLVFWLQHDTCFLFNGNWTEGRLGHTVLRYHAAYIPVGIARAKAHREIYLEKPLAPADVGILESGTSFYNVQGTRGGLSEFSGLLYRQSHNFGYLFEWLVMEGKQSLDGYKVIILPNAACLPDAFTDKLLAWVKGGGVLVGAGATGVMNEYAVVTGRLPDAALGKGRWSYEKGRLDIKDGTEGILVLARNSSNRPALVEKGFGKGKICLRVDTVGEEAVYGVISRYAPRQFYGKQNNLHMAMRQGKGEATKYLSLLNPDCNETREEEIVLAGEYKRITDISDNFPIVPRISGGETSFKIRLSPAETAMIRIEK